MKTDSEIFTHGVRSYWRSECARWTCARCG